MVTNESNLTITKIQSDNGKEYTSRKFIDICNKAGIQRNLIVPRNPQSNGRAERLNGTIINATKALLNQARLSYHFWEDAVKTAVKIYNMTPRTAIKFKFLTNYTTIKK